MIKSDFLYVWYACGCIYELQFGENCMAKNGWFGIYRSETAKNGQNLDLSWYISKWRDQVFMVFRIGYTNCFFKEFCDDLINHSWLYWTNSGCMTVCLSSNLNLYDAESKIHWPWVIQTENERSILRNIWFLDDLAVSIDVGNNKARINGCLQIIFV